LITAENEQLIKGPERKFIQGKTKTTVMKKTIIILTALVLFAVGAFANKGEDVPARVKTALQKDFSNALNVTWEKTDSLYSATFYWNSFEVTATFNDKGELLSTFRILDFAQLPLKVSLAITEKYNGYTIKGHIAEVVNEDGTFYHFSLENEKKVLALISSNVGELEVEMEIKK
jgi:hypothetical protein